MAKKVQRNSLAAQILHGSHTITCFILLITGFAFTFDYFDLLGGVQRVQSIHRTTGYIFILVPLVIVIFRFKGFLHFMKDMLTWYKEDIQWLGKMHSYLLDYENTEMPLVKGSHNPGQKLTGTIMIFASVIIAITGALIIFYPQLMADIDLLTIHRWSVYVLAAILVGHTFLGLGGLKQYRGMWRAMLGGKLDAKFAKKHWPVWYEEYMEKEKEKESGN
ncbi:cytochrome b/b6 domain-containing protein [Natroniella sulfidigena]|uniref:cytochrome b/b6 domain-containing protein n=1 Tax=Natroniella sulfidigena TaxID=723921 RepID=UPI00200A405D|nr:cytochrome b/b6 domain-containing protein [Natroniella sulfidigena]MCK8816096.1 cytochrome b/b6 domain-containing protein [Natroniella sulfidigena]